MNVNKNMSSENISKYNNTNNIIIMNYIFRQSYRIIVIRIFRSHAYKMYRVKKYQVRIYAHK